MAKADSGTASTESGIEVGVIERTVERTGVDETALCDALVIVHAELIGRHSQFERDRDYVTVDGTRAYCLPESVCDELLEDFEFADDVGRG